MNIAQQLERAAAVRIQKRARGRLARRLWRSRIVQTRILGKGPPFLVDQFIKNFKRRLKSSEDIPKHHVSKESRLSSVFSFTVAALAFQGELDNKEETPTTNKASYMNRKLSRHRHHHETIRVSARKFYDELRWGSADDSSDQSLLQVFPPLRTLTELQRTLLEIDERAGVHRDPAGYAEVLLYRVGQLPIDSFLSRRDFVRLGMKVFQSFSEKKNLEFQRLETVSKRNDNVELEIEPEKGKKNTEKHHFWGNYSFSSFSILYETKTVAMILREESINHCKQSLCICDTTWQHTNNEQKEWKQTQTQLLSALDFAFERASFVLREALDSNQRQQEKRKAALKIQAISRGRAVRQGKKIFFSEKVDDTKSDSNSNIFIESDSLLAVLKTGVGSLHALCATNIKDIPSIIFTLLRNLKKLHAASYEEDQFREKMYLLLEALRDIGDATTKILDPWAPIQCTEMWESKSLEERKEIAKSATLRLQEEHCFEAFRFHLQGLSKYKEENESNILVQLSKNTSPDAIVLQKCDFLNLVRLALQYETEDEKLERENRIDDRIVAADYRKEDALRVREALRKSKRRKEILRMQAANKVDWRVSSRAAAQLKRLLIEREKMENAFAERERERKKLEKQWKQSRLERYNEKQRILNEKRREARLKDRIKYMGIGEAALALNPDAEKKFVMKKKKKKLRVPKDELQSICNRLATPKFVNEKWITRRDEYIAASEKMLISKLSSSSKKMIKRKELGHTSKKRVEKDKMKVIKKRKNALHSPYAVGLNKEGKRFINRIEKKERLWFRKEHSNSSSSKQTKWNREGKQFTTTRRAVQKGKTKIAWNSKEFSESDFYNEQQILRRQLLRQLLSKKNQNNEEWESEVSETVKKLLVYSKVRKKVK
eukprot:g5813.t1